MSDASHKSVPEWAKDKACALFNEVCGEAGTGYVPNWRPLLHGNHPTVIAFARYIAEHEEAPVDPLLIEAREIASKVFAARNHDTNASVVIQGGMDSCDAVQAALAALKEKRSER